MKLSLADRIRLLRHDANSFREVARELHVSERTLRRWKNEGVKPSASKAGSVEHLVKQSAKVRRRVVARAKREGFDLSDVPVPVDAKRIQRIDPYDPDRKRRIPSDTVELSSRARTDTNKWVELLIRYRDRQNRKRARAAFRSVVIMHGSFESEGRMRRGGPTMTEWEEINEWSDDEIIEWANQVDEDGTIIALRVLSGETPGKNVTNQPNRKKARKTLGASKGSKRRR